MILVPFNLRKLVFMFMIISGLFAGGFVAYLGFRLPTLVSFAWISLSIAGLLAIGSIGIFHFFTYSQWLHRILNIKFVQLHQITGIIFSLVIPFIGGYYFFEKTGQSLSDFQFFITDNAIVNFIIYILGIIFFELAGFSIYFGIQYLRAKIPISKIKTSILALFSIILIAGVSTGIAFLEKNATFGFVGDFYQWNDGPWLTWESDPSTTITISWLTKYPTNTNLKFGTSPASLEEIGIGSTHSYLHRAYISDLHPNTTYYYQIGIEFSAFSNKEEIFHFQTAPVTPDDFRFVVVGDMQPTDYRTLSGGNLVAIGIHAVKPNFVVQLGDIASNGGNINHWHNLFQNMPLFSAYSPFQGAIGNHDYGADGSFNYRNILPHNYVSTQGNYYSFDYGSAHIICIDNMVEGLANEAQKQWVEADLTSAKTRGQKWIFIAFHKTLFTTATSGQYFEIQQWLVPLVDKFDVDGVFFGHDHHYEHWNWTYGSTGVLYNASDSPSGNETHYWCSGGGGAHLEVGYGLLTHSPWTESHAFWNITANEYQILTFDRQTWNRDRYVDNSTHLVYAESLYDSLYYHAPDRESYSNSTAIYGYDYGEQTLHYILVEVSNEGNTCTISARYPNGDLLLGPDNAYPQQWKFNK